MNDLDFLVTCGLKHRADIFVFQLLERYEYSVAKDATEDNHNHPSMNTVGHAQQTSAIVNFIGSTLSEL